MIMSKQEGLPKSTFSGGNRTFLIKEDTGHLKPLLNRDEVGEISSTFFRTQSSTYNCDQICQEDVSHGSQHARKPSEESALTA